MQPQIGPLIKFMKMPQNFTIFLFHFTSLGLVIFAQSLISDFKNKILGLHDNTALWQQVYTILQFWVLF